MSHIRRLTAILLALSILLAVFPSGAAEADGQARTTHEGVFLDTDPAGGYAGDYVVICNPSADTVTGASTGSLGGLIETGIGGANAECIPAQTDGRPARIDVDPLMKRRVPDESERAPEMTVRDWQVGDEKDFSIRYYSPSGNPGNIRFKVLYVGAHCRVWTPVNSAYLPLDGIDSSFARRAAEEFDGKFGLMRSSFGDFRDTANDGRVNMLFYNIDEGWTPGSSYVAGYFWSGDYQINSLPVIHVDTYPGITRPGSDGNTVTELSSCYGTLMHEFQHLINYSMTGGMHDWLDESFSGAAEEICYPGSSLFPRIQSWQGYPFTSLSQLTDPIAETPYRPDFRLHRGGSLAYWNNSDQSLDLLSRYAGVLFFSQYLYTRYGSTTVFRRIMENCSGGSLDASLTALTRGTGWDIGSIWRDYAISMIANSRVSGWGFSMNPGYDPSEYYGVEDLYRLLPAVIYDSPSPAYIQGGGFIAVKPVEGVFVPPEDASSALVYVGVSFPDFLPGDVNSDGAVDTEDALQTLRCALGLIVFDDDRSNRADIDRNGIVDTTDALLILRSALGIH